MINAFGLGALNIYWIVGGTIFVLLNVTPLSLDCSASMESFFSLPHECTSLEFWLNYMWCFAIAGWSVTCVVLALLPKLVNDYTPAANKAVMLTVSGVFLGFQLFFGYATVALPLKIEGTAIKSMPTYHYMMTLWVICLLLAGFFHKEPATGKGLLSGDPPDINPYWQSDSA